MPQSSVMENPWIISVDDHVTPPPDLWTSRLPARFLERAPRVERDRVTVDFQGAHATIKRGDPAGKWTDFWVYEDSQEPLMAVTNIDGFEGESRREALQEFTVMTYDDLGRGCWQQGPRLDAMTANRVEASLCFPNAVTRFCGQTFNEKGGRDVGLLCIQAYNDWMIDDWCAGQGAGRLIPLTLIPLWDAELAASEVRRCAAKGSHAGFVLREPVGPGPAVLLSRVGLLEPLLPCLRADRDGGQHAHRVVFPAAHLLGRRPLRRHLGPHVPELHGVGAGPGLLRRA